MCACIAAEHALSGVVTERVCRPAAAVLAPSTLIVRLSTPIHSEHGVHQQMDTRLLALYSVRLTDRASMRPGEADLWRPSQREQGQGRRAARLHAPSSQRKGVSDVYIQLSLDCRLKRSPLQSPARSSSSVSKSASSSSPAVKAGVDLDELRQQKAWELATSPAKAVPMQAFMMYMSGSGIQIFSIMSVWFLLKQAVGGAMGVQQGPSCSIRVDLTFQDTADRLFHPSAAFAGFDAAIKPKAKVPAAADTEDSLPPSFLEQKIVYVVCQVGLLVSPFPSRCSSSKAMIGNRN